MKNHRVGGNLSDTEMTPYSFSALNQVSRKTDGVRMHGLALHANAHQMPCAPSASDNQSLIIWVNESGVSCYSVTSGGPLPDVAMALKTDTHDYVSQAVSYTENAVPFEEALMNYKPITTIVNIKNYSDDTN